MGLLTSGGKPVLFGAKVLLAALGAGSTSPPAGSDAGAVTLSEATLLDYQIYQHVGGSKAVPVAGTVTGADGVVEARIVDEITGAQITAWAAVGTSSGGAFSGSITMAKGLSWGKVEARKASNPSVVTTGIKRFGVGEWVVLAGQSNMEHLWTSARQSAPWYPLGSPKVRGIEVKLSGGSPVVGSYGRVGNINDSYAPSTSFGSYPSYTAGVTDNGDGLVYFANQLVTNLGCLVGVIPCAIGGTNIDQWQQGQVYWNSMLAAINAAGGDVGTALWYQGEQNASAGNSGAAYNTKLGTLHGSLKTALNREGTALAFGVVTLGPCTTYGAEGTFGAIRAVQAAYATNPGCFLAGVAGDASSPSSDTVHITVDSQIRMGRRYAKSVAAYLAGSPKPGPKIASATRSGATITVIITGGTGVLKDGAGGTGGSLLGFRVFDNGAAATITGTAISGSTVVLTLAAAPSGSVTLDYGMANTPYGSSTTPPASAILYDSDTVPGDTLGLPLQPCAAITVS